MYLSSIQVKMFYYLGLKIRKHIGFSTKKPMDRKEKERHEFSQHNHLLYILLFTVGTKNIEPVIFYRNFGTLPRLLGNKKKQWENLIYALKKVEVWVLSSNRFV